MSAPQRPRRALVGGFLGFIGFAGFAGAQVFRKGSRGSGFIRLKVLGLHLGNLPDLLRALDSVRRYRDLGALERSGSMKRPEAVLDSREHNYACMCTRLPPPPAP